MKEKNDWIAFGWLILSALGANDKPFQMVSTCWARPGPQLMADRHSLVHNFSPFFFFSSWRSFFFFLYQYRKSRRSWNKDRNRSRSAVAVKEPIDRAQQQQQENPSSFQLCSQTGNPCPCFTTVLLHLGRPAAWLPALHRPFFLKLLILELSSTKTSI